MADTLFGGPEGPNNPLKSALFVVKGVPKTHKPVNTNWPGGSYNDAALRAEIASLTSKIDALDIEEIKRSVSDIQTLLQGAHSADVTGHTSISTKTATHYELNLTGDTELTIVDATPGQVVVIDVLLATHTLLVTDGPKITADGLYALTLSRGKWKGGTTGTASTGGGSTGGTGGGDSTGGTTGGGSTDGTTTDAIEIAHMNLTGVADGTLAQNVTLSNGVKFVNAGGQVIVKGGALTAKDGSGESSVKFPAVTPKQRITVTYTLPPKGGDYTGAAVRLGINSASSLRIANDAKPDVVGANDDGMEVTPTGAPPPLSGTCVIVNDASAGKVTWTINGVLIATATKKAPASTDKALGASLLVNGDKSVPEGDVKITAFKIEALT